MAVPQNKSSDIDLNVTPYYPLDPRRIYDDSAALNAQKSHGFERLVYKIFGPSLIGSLAFAIDPLHDFAKYPYIKTQSLRKRVRPIRTYSRVLYSTKRSRTRSNYRQSDGSYPSLIDSWDNVKNSQGIVVASRSQYESVRPAQPALQEYSIDTTFSTRPDGSPGGYFEKFENSFSAGNVKVRKKTFGVNTFPDNQASDSWSDESRIFRGPYGYLSLSSQTTLYNLEKQRATRLMVEYAPKLLPKCLPTTPRFELLRAIGELKDYRHGGSLSQRATNMASLLSDIKRNPDLFLSLEFGIKPLISDVKALLATPRRVAIQLNKLLERSGKPTTYRTKLLLEPPTIRAPSFSYGSEFDICNIKQTGTSLTHVSELRMSVNSTFEFPPVELPVLRDDLVNRLWGTEPTVTTLYNLTPWSWLIDWFTGFGDYLNCIEKINTDPSLINYGYISYVSKCSLYGSAVLEWTDTDSRLYRPADWVNSNVVRTVTTSQAYNYSFHMRKDLSELGVSSTFSPNTLSGDKQKIILALIAQRSR